METLKDLGKIVAGAILVVGSLQGANCYQHQGVSYLYGDRRHLEKADFFLGNTQLEIGGYTTELRKTGLNSIFYTDNGNDGVVDEIFISPFLLARGAHSVKLDRTKDLGRHTATFLEADRELAEQMERFGQRRLKYVPKQDK